MAKPEEKPAASPAEAAPQPPAEPKKYYLLVGKTTIKGPFTAAEMREQPDFLETSKIAPLGATKSSHWKPVERFEELRAIIEERKAAKAAPVAAKPGEVPKPAPQARPPAGHH